MDACFFAAAPRKTAPMVLGARLESARRVLASSTATAYGYIAHAAHVLSDTLDAATPYATKAFHYGLIPLVIFLGMRSEPRPKLTDLLTPM